MRAHLIAAFLGWAVTALALAAAGIANSATLIPGIIIGILLLFQVERRQP